MDNVDLLTSHRISLEAYMKRRARVEIDRLNDPDLVPYIRASAVGSRFTKYGAFRKLVLFNPTGRWMMERDKITGIYEVYFEHEISPKYFFQKQVAVWVSSEDIVFHYSEDSKIFDCGATL